MINQYELRTYEINPHQLKILKEIKSLPRKRLHYVVGQQSSDHPNLTLPEIKKLIRRGLRQYIQETTLNYHQGLENHLVKFYCVFETKKDFSQSQYENTLRENVKMGIHFHLFLTSPDDYPWISFPSLIHTIFNELTSIKHKRFCLSKYDYDKINELDDNFILYHTKQFMFRPSVEMVMKNL